MKNLFRTFVALVYLASATLGQAGFVTNSFLSAAPPVLTFIASTGDAANATTYTFTGASIGTAAPDRLVIVGVTGIDAGTQTCTSMTIGGNAATEYVDLGGTLVATCIYGLVVTSGTTANIVVTFSVAGSAAAIAVWTATGLISTTPGSTNTANTSPLSAAVTVSDGGFVVAVCNRQNSTGATWTGGITEQSDISVDSNLVHHSAASDSYATGGTVTPVCTQTGSDTDDGMAVAAFR